MTIGKWKMVPRASTFAFLSTSAILPLLTAPGIRPGRTHRNLVSSAVNKVRRIFEAVDDGKVSEPQIRFQSASLMQPAQAPWFRRHNVRGCRGSMELPFEEFK